MRTIKFKAKAANGEWVVGSLLHRQDGSVYIYDDNNDVPFSGLVCSEEETALRIPVDRNTVCQFTGFLDKKGKEIYEGDVLRSDKEPSGIFPLDKDPHMAVVCWSEEHGVFYRMTFKDPKARVFQNANRSCHVLSRFIRSYEVIGNIHDPEWKQKFGGRTERELSIEIFDND